VSIVKGRGRNEAFKEFTRRNQYKRWKKGARGKKRAGRPFKFRLMVQALQHPQRKDRCTWKESGRERRRWVVEDGYSILERLVRGERLPNRKVKKI